MKLYIAGPMAGRHRFNFSAFDRASEALQAAGHDVVSPADLDRVDGQDREVSHDFGGDQWVVGDLQRAWFLRRDIGWLVQCDGIVLLDDWDDSVGANVELMVARASGLKVFRFYDTKAMLRPSGVMPRMDLVNKHVYAVAEREVAGLV